MTNGPTRIAILGSYPPHYGGISVHVWRLRKLFEDRCTVDVIDMYAEPSTPDEPGVHRIRGNVLLRLLRARLMLFRLSPDIFHVHVSAMRKFLLTTPILLSGGEGKRVLTIHGGKFSQNVAGFNRVQMALLKWMLGRFDHIVCVSALQQETLVELGVNPDDTSVINAYLPPSPHKNNALFSPVIARREAGKTIVLISAPFLEHYGLLELFQALHALPEPLREGVCVVHITYLDVDPSYEEACKVAAAGLDYLNYDRIDPFDVSALFALGDIFTRPTWWDGDAVSVREAAFFGNRLIATDVTTRPPGSVMCEAKSVASLASAIERTLEDPSLGVVEFDHGTSLRALEQVYKKVSPPGTAIELQANPD